MGTTGTASSWDRIRLGMKDAERLMGQSQYNLAMIKCRQTLEIMVRSLADKACLVDADLSVTIDDLYQGKWISRTTCDHYHKIRMIGNKAVHEGNDSAYDADQALHLLSLEVYTFSNDYKASKPKTWGPAASSGGGTSVNRNRRGSKRSKKGFAISQTGMLRILIGVLCLIFIIILVSFLKPDKKGDADKSASASTETTLPEATTPPETMAQTTPAPVYKTSTVLNVRAEPSTSASIRGQLLEGTIVDYVGAYDDDWSIITYEGQQAYVATQYLVHD